MKYVKDRDGIEMAMPDGDNTPKVDPSVLVTDLYLKGPMKGEVDMSVTIGKPSAYYPSKDGPK
jgi:hypothetical protein